MYASIEAGLFSIPKEPPKRASVFTSKTQCLPSERQLFSQIVQCLRNVESIPAELVAQRKRTFKKP